MLKLTVTADIEALPNYVGRIENAAVNQGEELDGFNIWPAIRPRVTLDRSERLTVSLRIRRSNQLAGTLPAQEGSLEGVAYKLRQDGATYWLDLAISPPSEVGRRIVPINLKVNEGLVHQLGLAVNMNVEGQGLVASPSVLDLGEKSIDESSGLVARVGIRRSTGSFQLRRVSSTLSFLKLETLTVVAGSNYVIRITIAPGSTLPQGAQNGAIVIETDDSSSPRLEVPVRIVFPK